jgi:hypothetical protein
VATRKLAACSPATKVPGGSCFAVLLFCVWCGFIATSKLGLLHDPARNQGAFLEPMLAADGANACCCYHALLLLLPLTF